MLRLPPRGKIEFLRLVLSPSLTHRSPSSPSDFLLPVAVIAAIGKVDSTGGAFSSHASIQRMEYAVEGNAGDLIDSLLNYEGVF